MITNSCVRTMVIKVIEKWALLPFKDYDGLKVLVLEIMMD